MHTLHRSMLASALSGFVFASCAPAKGSHAEEGSTPANPAVADTMPALGPHAIETVWVIVMENKSWSSVKGSPDAPYINDTLLRLGAHAEAYRGTSSPSEPNYIWMEAADELAIADNDDPSANYRTTKNHLTRHLENAGVTWRSYQEDVEADRCPLSSSGRYAAKHNPFVFFDDVTDARDPLSAHCIEHIRPFGELERDLADTDRAARYNFITPNLCNDMHDQCEADGSIATGDRWLSREVPKILASEAYRAGGAIFITWDESEGGRVPIGMIAISPFAKPGYQNTVAYTHSSLVRTVQEIFAVRPFMRDAGNAHSLSDLFATYP